MKRVLTSTLIVLLLATARSTADTAVGWRTDGSGVYPDATPVTEWGPEKNVIWRVKMPSWSNSTPVIVGDKIFNCTEPNLLLCLRKSDGEILWQRETKLEDAMTEADKAAQPEMNKKADAIRAKNNPLNKQSRKVWRDIRELTNKARNLKKEDKELDEADKAKLTDLKKLNQDLRSQISQLQKQLEPLTRWERPGTQKTNGYTSPTPVSDGKHVWVHYNTGVLACYDMEGERKWVAYVDRPQHGWGLSASPVLADGKVLVHVKFMKAFDAKTGELLWTADGTKWAWGTPLITTVGDTAVAVTAKGQIIRVSDGKVLGGGPAGLTYNAPVVVGDVVYHIQGGGTAVKLSPDEDKVVDAKVLWRTSPKTDRYYGSPVVVDGLIYAITQRSHFSIIDAKTGKVINGDGKGEQLKLGKGTCYPSLSAAGEHILVSSDNGTTIVFKAGRTPEVVATNKLDTFRSCPVFEDGRMYLRTYEYLYCIGAK
jgi:hypothetical protein